jgi:hypothetical protein
LSKNTAAFREMLINLTPIIVSLYICSFHYANGTDKANLALKER